MKMNLIHRLLPAALAFLLSFQTDARPARPGAIILQQPDGTSFSALLKGDEFLKVRTTAQGHAIVQDEDGWWCYAVFDEDGRRHSSGCRVGSDAPRAVVSQSLDIPFAGIAANSVERMRLPSSPDDGTPLLARIRNRAYAATKVDVEIPGTAQKHGLVILAQFSDIKFRYTRENFLNMLMQEGYAFNGATGSAKEYFDAQFNGMFEFTFDVSDIVTVSRERAYYGGNDSYGDDKAPAELIVEACRLADDSVDFSRFDDDGDGTVDNVFVFFAGGDEAEGDIEDCIWSHSWYIKTGAGLTLALDGKTIDRYACTSELSRVYSGNSFTENLAGIGTFCHEYSHTFGLPDLYDTDYDDDGGWAAGLWTKTALMDGGNQNNHGNTPPYFNAIERELLGLSEPQIIESDGAYTLEPIHLAGQYFKMLTDTEGEYYLFECRAATGWDAYIGGSGMLVYHIDRTAKQLRRWTIDNTVNAVQSHQCADLIEADGRSDALSNLASSAVINGIFFPYGDVTSLTYDTTPGLQWWYGEKGKLSLTDIRSDGEDIRFSIIGGSEATTPPIPEKLSYEAFTDAAIIIFQSSRPYEGEATVKWGRTGKDEWQEINVSPYEEGKYSVTLENLESGGKTYTVIVNFAINGAVGESRTISFMTKKKPSSDWPFIYLSGVSRNSDGTFPVGSRLPMRVYNASGAQKVEWFFDGKPVKAGGDGYYVIGKSGELKAKVFWEDGSTDTIVKEIITGEE